MSARFSMSRGSVDRAKEELHMTEKRLCALAENIRVCKSCLHLSSDSVRSIKASLESVREQILYEASVTAKFRRAVEYAVSRYTSCEEQVLRQIEAAEKEAERSIDRGTDKRGLLEQAEDRLFGEDKTAALIATTEEQHAASDKELKWQIEVVMNTEHFSKETWKRSSVEERKQILQDYVQDVSQILGIHIKKEVEFFAEEPVNGILTNGYYHLRQNRIYINEYVMNAYAPEDSYYLMTTIVHELRHVYQSQSMEKPTKFQVDQETLDQWEENVKNYQDSQTEGFQSYRKQPVEADARIFAGQESK